ncbi:MAG: hypothetical protein IGQ88_07720 [Gloeomargaritaceae cyanobacterium C42_A2020_066]|nr:hypothetical protein [Gloeomargaritaceae cyanobacterium C42_A2020_066]
MTAPVLTQSVHQYFQGWDWTGQIKPSAPSTGWVLADQTPRAAAHPAVLSLAQTVAQFWQGFAWEGGGVGFPLGATPTDVLEVEEPTPALTLADFVSLF